MRSEEPLGPLPSWEELRRAALETREELRVAQARTARQEAAVRIRPGRVLAHGERRRGAELGGHGLPESKR